MKSCIKKGVHDNFADDHHFVALGSVKLQISKSAAAAELADFGTISSVRLVHRKNNLINTEYRKCLIFINVYQLYPPSLLTIFILHSHFYSRRAKGSSQPHLLLSGPLLSEFHSPLLIVWTLQKILLPVAALHF